MAQGLVNNGAWCRVKLEIDGVLKQVGLAQGVSYDESFNLQSTQVLGQLEALSYDPMRYTLSISMSTFVPSKKVIGQYADGGEITVKDILPTVREVWKTGIVAEFPTMILEDARSGEVLEHLKDVMLDSSSANIQAGNLTTKNLKFFAIERL